MGEGEKFLKLCEPHYIGKRDLRIKFKQDEDFEEFWNKLLDYRRSVGKEIELKRGGNSYFYYLDQNTREKLSYILKEINKIKIHKNFKESQELKDLILEESLASYNLSFSKINDCMTYYKAKEVIENKISNDPYYKHFSTYIDAINDIDNINISNSFLKRIHCSFSGKGEKEFNRKELNSGNKLKEHEFNLPKVEKIEEMMEKLMEFINKNSYNISAEQSIINGIILHFEVVFIRPFKDYNGRIARFLMLLYYFKTNLHQILFLQLSQTINWEAHLYQYDVSLSNANDIGNKDENDLSYFMMFYIKIMYESLIYFKTKNKPVLNKRQQNAIDALKTGELEELTVTEYNKEKEISRVTAKKEIEELEEMGLIYLKKIFGKTHVYVLKKLDINNQ